MHLTASRRAPRLISLLVAILLAPTALTGCRHQPATGPSAAAPAGQAADETAQGATRWSEAERTKAMEEKARQMDQKAAEIQTMQGTEQEKIDAVNKLEQERQELNKTGGDGSAPAAAPPPQ
jgi:TolA-binding protein